MKNEMYSCMYFDNFVPPGTPSAFVIAFAGCVIVRRSSVCQHFLGCISDD